MRQRGEIWGNHPALQAVRPAGVRSIAFWLPWASRVGFRQEMSPAFEVLHFIGCDNDRGGMISVVRNLASAGQFRCVLGINRGGVQERQPPLPVLELSPIEAEKISARNFWRARKVAREIQTWLRADNRRIYHGHSRAGLLVALWLRWMNEPRVVVSVHCYGRQRWFYRWAFRRLGNRLYWLSPAMKKYYGFNADDWSKCIPGCVKISEDAGLTTRKARPDGGVIRLGGIGALVRWKKWHLILDALVLLPPEIRTKFRFSHIGGEDGSSDSQAYANELRSRTESSSLNRIVEWRGQQGSSEKFLESTDCLLILSHNEPFSVAMLEALQAGVPVLASDSGGACDIIGAVKGGWLFRENQVRDLADHLVTLATGEILARTEIDRDRLKQFEAPVVAESWRKVYQQLAS